jgi:hypothetical protein
MKLRVKVGTPAITNMLVCLVIEQLKFKRLKKRRKFKNKKRKIVTRILTS